jgi:hypothetical protein
MTPLAMMFQDEIVRAVVADRPAMTYPIHQPTVLADHCELLADCSEAKRLLRANGHGEPGMNVLELVQLLLTASVPAKPKRARRRKGKR